MDRAARQHARSSWLVVLTAFAIAICSAPAAPSHALDADAHRAVTLRALKGVADVDYVMTPTQKELVEFYRWLAFAMAKGGQPDLQQRFQQRYPKPEDFDAIGARRFLGLTVSGRSDVWGMTRLLDNSAEQRTNLIALASAYPLTDLRCVDPVLMGDDGKPAKHASGSIIPLDPQMLRHGPPLGPGSDAWSHDALAIGKPDAVTEFADPDPSWRQPGLAGASPINYPAQLAQVHVDMAVLARVWGDMMDQVVGEQIATMWLGAAIHYVQDAALPTAAVESGGAAFARAIDRGHLVAAMRTFGGYNGDLMPRAWRQHRARRNLHVLAQWWLRRQIEAHDLKGAAHPAIKAALGSLDTDDATVKASLTAVIQPWLNGARYVEPHAGGIGGATKLVEALSAISARDGPAMLDAMTALAAPTVANGEVALLVLEDVRAEHWRDGAPSSDAEAEAALAAIVARALRRASTATRLTHQLWLNGNSDSAARRLQAGRLGQLAAAEARVVQWLKAPAILDAPIEDTRVPVAAGAALLGLILGVFALIRRRNRSSQDG